MLEKLKSVGEAAKNVAIFILTPLAFVAGLLYYFINQNRDLKEELNEARGEAEDAKNLAKENAIDEKANTVVDDYHKLRSEYLNPSDPNKLH